MNNTKNKIVYAFAALCLGTGLFSSCGPDKKEKEEQQQTIKQEDAIDTPSVVAAPVQKGKLVTTIAVPGELVP
jgi:membrane fusion protein (multidrug efflux system)